jgi:signal transduction histidine kinase
LEATQAQLIHAEKMASLGELTAGIAHEIQNPLNFVNNFSEINEELIEELKDELNNGNLEDAKVLTEDLSKNEKKIKHHGKRAEGIVKSMLQHSGTNSGQKEPADLNALCDEYLRLAYHGMRARDKSFQADFQTDLDPSMPMIQVVPQDIGRLLLNLINNAFHAVHEKAKMTKDTNYKPIVKVATKIHPLNPASGGQSALSPSGQPSAKAYGVRRGGAGGGSIQITISDNGPGIPDTIKDKIFQPFFTTKPTGEGTGLGLSLSYDIVKVHGGEIEVMSEEDKGTAFKIKLPIG